MPNLSRKTLDELTPLASDFFVTVIILSKSDPNIFQLKDSSEQRSVFCLTIRDSRRGVTNCKCWGTKEKIEEYHRKFNIYDVIDIICPKVIPSQSKQEDQHFQPAVPLTYQLTLNEGIGLIEKHVGEIKQISILCHTSIRPLNSVLNLMDIYSTNVNFKGHYVDLLVVIALIKPVKDVRAKSGFPLKCAEVILIDKSLPKGMLLTIWNSGWIYRSQKYWIPMKTVLHLIDAKVGYSDFYKTTTVGLGAKSLIIENPSGKESDKILEFVANTSILLEGALTKGFQDDLPNPDTITNLMTVRQVYDNITGKVHSDSEEFTAILLAMVTKFDLEDDSSIVARKCKSCCQWLPRNQQVCDNDQCQMSFSFNFSGEKFDQFLDINIHLSDHTGTLTQAHITDKVAEKILSLTLQEFMRINEQSKEKLRKKCILERYEVKILVKKPTSIRKKLIIKVLDMKSVCLSELSERILVY